MRRESALSSRIEGTHIILSLDQTPVHTVDDARLEILFKKKGEPAKVRILRKEPAGGEKKMEFEVTPQ